MKHIIAILKKQGKDTLKNKTVLIQFLMFPILTLVMSNAINIEGMPENFFVNLFAVMYAGMAPLASMASTIAEEKEKNTLRVLMMANVKPYEYLLGIGIYVWSICMAGSTVICTAGGFSPKVAITFLGLMAAGIAISTLIGAAIGAWSQTQMMAASVTVPVMMVFSFLPMLSLFNATIGKIAKFTYSEQLRLMISQAEHLRLEVENIGILAANMLVFAVLFTIAYKKCKLA